MEEAPSTRNGCVVVPHKVIGRCFTQPCSKGIAVNSAAILGRVLHDKRVADVWLRFHLQEEPSSTLGVVAGNAAHLQLRTRQVHQCKPSTMEDSAVVRDAGSHQHWLRQSQSEKAPTSLGCCVKTDRTDIAHWPRILPDAHSSTNSRAVALDEDLLKAWLSPVPEGQTSAGVCAVVSDSASAQASADRVPHENPSPALRGLVAIHATTCQFRAGCIPHARAAPKLPCSVVQELRLIENGAGRTLHQNTTAAHCSGVAPDGAMSDCRPGRLCHEHSASILLGHVMLDGAIVKHRPRRVCNSNTSTAQPSIPHENAPLEDRRAVLHDKHAAPHRRLAALKCQVLEDCVGLDNQSTVVELPIDRGLEASDGHWACKGLVHHEAAMTQFHNSKRSCLRHSICQRCTWGNHAVPGISPKSCDPPHKRRLWGGRAPVSRSP
mmetsp:Transcript_89336/g.207937  ORF Transcript_89336/g.207937 Transcript_89336/m.207937 type:complete len:435 (-) Transcript_89336:149-1453(-)